MLTSTLLVRTAPPDASLLGMINADDGDRDFAHGLVSDRFDVFSEAELEWQGLGARVSLAGWYDPAVFGRTDNTSPLTYNPLSVPDTRLPGDSRRLDGLDGELLDAVFRAHVDVAGLPVTIRVGQFALLWGESLYLTDNGIAAGLAPVDEIKASAVPDTPARELYRPVPQAWAAVQLSSRWSVETFVQPVFRADRLPGVGSYFSQTDLLDAGGERFLLTPGVGVPRAPDTTPDAWQFGAAVRLTLADITLGLYGLRYDSKQGFVALSPRDYRIVYPSDIALVGVSASADLGRGTLAGEISARHDAPLASETPVLLPGEAPVARGDTLHAQISYTGLIAPSRLWDQASVSGEIAANQRLSVLDGEAVFDRSRTALGGEGRAVLSLDYFQVHPGLDLSPSFSIGGGLFGRSSLATTTPFGAGDLEAGLDADYHVVWHATLSWTHYLGRVALQPLDDRDFLTLSVRRDF